MLHALCSFAPAQRNAGRLLRLVRPQHKYVYYQDRVQNTVSMYHVPSYWLKPATVLVNELLHKHRPSCKNGGEGEFIFGLVLVTNKEPHQVSNVRILLSLLWRSCIWLFCAARGKQYLALSFHAEQGKGVGPQL